MINAYLLLVLTLGVNWGAAYSVGFATGARWLVAFVVIEVCWFAWGYGIYPLLTGVSVLSAFAAVPTIQSAGAEVIAFLVAVFAIEFMLLYIGYRQGKRHRQKPPKSTQDPVPSQALLNTQYGGSP